MLRHCLRRGGGRAQVKESAHCQADSDPKLAMQVRDALDVHVSASGFFAHNVAIDALSVFGLIHAEPAAHLLHAATLLAHLETRGGPVRQLMAQVELEPAVERLCLQVPPPPPLLCAVLASIGLGPQVL